MPQSVVGAVIARYEGFTFAGKPPLYFDEAPLKRPDGTPLVPPYVVLHHDGTAPDYTLEYELLERTKLRFEVYAPSLAAAVAVALGVRFDGQDFRAGKGMDWADALPLTGLALKAAEWGGEQQWQEGGRGPAAGPVFRQRLTYTVTTQRTGP